MNFSKTPRTTIRHMTDPALMSPVTKERVASTARSTTRGFLVVTRSRQNHPCWTSTATSFIPWTARLVSTSSSVNPSRRVWNLSRFARVSAREASISSWETRMALLPCRCRGDNRGRAPFEISFGIGLFLSSRPANGARVRRFVSSAKSGLRTDDHVPLYVLDVRCTT